MKLSHAFVLVASLFIYSCNSYPEYTKGTDELGYSYAKKIKRYSNIDKALQNPEEVYFLDIAYMRSDSAFQDLDKHVEKFVNLKKLTIWAHPTEENYFPKNIFKCRSLEFLAISNFRERKPSDWEAVGNLDQLVFLALGNCDLQAIPSAVYEIKSIEGMDFTLNNISNIPPEIANLSNLKTIDLTNNCFTEFPVNLKECPELKYVDMNNAEGKSEAALAELGLCANKLKKVEGLEHFKNLKEIFIIQSVPPVVAYELKAKYPNIKIK